MTRHDLRSNDGLRAAIEALGPRTAWDTNASRWVPRLAEVLRWVRAADERERATREFQERLWERNQIAATGQGHVSIEEALDNAEFRQWLAARSLQPLPSIGEPRLQFLTALYEDLKSRLAVLLSRQKTPHLKIFRVMAALYPEGMTTVAAVGKLHELAKAMGSERRLTPVERHTFVRSRLDDILGLADDTPEAQAERLTIPWLLYDRFVQSVIEVTESTPQPGEEARLLPLPAARRRRGLTAIRGLFPGVLSTLDFVRDGVTREELLDFLRAASPEAKESSLGVQINALQGELGVIRSEGGRYILTERGEDVLESQDPNDLADWILTRILGADRGITELRDRGPLPTAELLLTIRSMNPGWTTNFTPQAIVAWLRSFGVIEPTSQNTLALTELGRSWAARIDWQPEPLPSDADVPSAVLAAAASQPGEQAAVLPDVASIVAHVHSAGHFPAPLIVRLHAGLWSHARRHFAILAGLSGSGKTLLAREYAKAITGGEDRRRLTLAVQPGWHDPGALLGFTNPLRGDSYSRTAFLEFVLAASADPRKPYVTILDEMNLSHPEQYMAPLISAMETGDPIELHTEDDYFDGVPAAVAYPSNLVLIGTVNMDETTHGLSDKILDRAFVLEFWDVDLASYPRWGVREIPSDNEQRARELLELLMAALSPARLHFGWRVVDDVLSFLERASEAGNVLPFVPALDSVVSAKVLPKLRGDDTPRFREALATCEKGLKSFGLAESAQKVAELRQDVEATGSARFWR